MTNSINLRYDRTGPADAPDVLFLHGFTGQRDDWDEITRPLADRFRCLTVDLPGHGGTTVDGPDHLYAMEPTASALINLLDSHKIERCHLVGYSMGGRLGLYLALHYSRRFDRIVLESASPGLRTEPERAARRDHDEALARRLSEIPYETFLREWYGQPLFATLHRHPHCLEQLISRRAAADPSGYARSLRYLGTGSMPSLWPLLEEQQKTIGRRLLLITGAEDSKFTQIAAAMAALAPHTHIATVAGCGHNVHFENPMEFIRLVGAFLTE